MARYTNKKGVAGSGNAVQNALVGSIWGYSWSLNAPDSGDDVEGLPMIRYEQDCLVMSEADIDENDGSFTMWVWADPEIFGTKTETYQRDYCNHQIVVFNYIRDLVVTQEKAIYLRFFGLHDDGDVEEEYMLITGCGAVDSGELTVDRHENGTSARDHLRFFDSPALFGELSGGELIPDFPNNIVKATGDEASEYVMIYNEVDLHTMEYSDAWENNIIGAAIMWGRIEEMIVNEEKGLTDTNGESLKMVGPNGSEINGLSWIDKFRNAYYDEKERLDTGSYPSNWYAIGYHHYGNNVDDIIEESESYKDLLDSWSEVSKLWLTEFCYVRGSPSFPSNPPSFDEWRVDVERLMRYLEGQPKIERYAWFWMKGSWPGFEDAALVDISDNLTEAGTMYGNVPEDRVLIALTPGDAVLTNAELSTINNNNRTVLYEDNVIDYADWNVVFPRVWDDQKLALTLTLAGDIAGDGSKQCVFSIELRLVESGSVPPVAHTEVVFPAPVVPTPAKEVFTVTGNFTDAELDAWADGDGMNIRIIRWGPTHNGDDYTGEIHLIAAELEFTEEV